MASKVERAALRLHDRLQDKTWYGSVGVGDTHRGPTIFVYVRTSRHRELTKLEREGIDGYPVVIRATGPIKALARA